MDSVLVIFKQLIIMTLYCMIGICLHKTGLVTKEGCRAFSKLLLYVILPCVIISSFIRKNEREITIALALSTIVSICLVALAMAISRLFLRRQPVEEFSASFSNAGFMGIPLVTMALGGETVIYIAPFVALLNILQWTYGQNLLLGRKQPSHREILLNPLVLALAAGIILYAMPFSLPELLLRPISALSACNAPIAMIILGYYLAEIPLRQAFTEKSVWRVSLIRLVLIPLLSVFLVAWLPCIHVEVKKALVIAASAPVGINVAVYAELLGRDYKKAVILICHSSIVCLVTMPLIMLLVRVLIGT